MYYIVNKNNMMMNIAFDSSPLEALDFNHISHGLLTAVINSVLVWIAVVTAAVSFWKVKSTSVDPCCRGRDGASASLEPSHPPLEMHVASSSRKTVSVLERQGSTKVKFRVYYEEEEKELKELDEVEGPKNNYNVDDKNNKLGWWCEDRERMWDMGWYKGQDLTVLDGNVVRLWDGGRWTRASVEMVGCGGGRDVYGLY